ncbi:MAG: alpha-L-fucosidase [Bacteroidota bacterium]
MSVRTRIAALSLLLALPLACASNEQVAEPEDAYTADWESISAYEIPDWFADAKLGIFIHWGVYSVPAFGSEWYPRRMYERDSVRHASGRATSANTYIHAHHAETYGDPSEFGYKDFIPMFKAENFDANAWLDLFEEAGARYVIPVAEHHDSFAMYNSSHTRWNSVEMGPKRDVLAEIAEATRERGLYFGASSHLAFNWDYFTREEGWDTADPEYADFYGPAHEQYVDPVSEEYMAYWWDRTTEIIDKYQPDAMWFDFFIDQEDFVPYHAKLAAYYYNKGLEWDREVVLQTKNMGFESYPQGTHVLDIERGKLPGIHPYAWQTDTSVGTNSWGYVTNWISKSPNTIVDDLVDIVAKNGNLLLNVGPKSDGTIPEDQAEVLRELGGWLGQNGEAVYGTRPWTSFGEGPTKDAEGHHSEGRNKQLTAEDIRFTTKDDMLYAILMAWPESGTAVVKSLGEGGELDRAISGVTLLGHDGALEYEQTADGLMVTLPDERPNDYAYAIAVALN